MIAESLDGTLELKIVANRVAHPELREPVRKELSFAVERFAEPTTAVVGAKDMVLNYSDAKVVFLQDDPAGRGSRRRLQVPSVRDSANSNGQEGQFLSVLRPQTALLFLSFSY
jgi:hypothetical protein